MLEDRAFNLIEKIPFSSDRVKRCITMMVLREEMGIDHTQLPLHTQIFWLSWGKVLKLVSECINNCKFMQRVEHCLLLCSCMTFPSCVRLLTWQIFLVTWMHWTQCRKNQTLCSMYKTKWMPSPWRLAGGLHALTIMTWTLSKQWIILLLPQVGTFLFRY